MSTFEQTFAGIDATLNNVLGDDATLDVNGDGVTVVPVKGMFSAPWTEPRIGGLRTRALEPQFDGLTSDLSAAVKGTSVLTVSGNDYEVVDDEPDGTGRTVLILKPLS